MIVHNPEYKISDHGSRYRLSTPDSALRKNQNECIKKKLHRNVNSIRLHVKCNLDIETPQNRKISLPWSWDRSIYCFLYPTAGGRSHFGDKNVKSIQSQIYHIYHLFGSRAAKSCSETDVRKGNW